MLGGRQNLSAQERESFLNVVKLQSLVAKSVQNLYTCLENPTMFLSISS